MAVDDLFVRGRLRIWAVSAVRACLTGAAKWAGGPVGRSRQLERTLGESMIALALGHFLDAIRRF